jgi:hypothetical protein
LALSQGDATVCGKFGQPSKSNTCEAHR